ncbi:hypothetical protein [Flexithrix dorotheae]|uniref:hypothetical protein n=1 Tax=Flexithrix dorotheae TaxID=70993 RepID=UPI0003726A28|nr:hypothetical protein [Flexithrix dorotheae]
MKTIEEFTLQNMVLIESYLNGKLSEKERAEFYQRLEVDEELAEDLELVKTSNFFLEGKNKKASDSINRFKEFNQPNLKITKKVNIGKAILSNGFLAILGVIILAIFCTLLLFII